jgi:hypothetical protein
MSDDRARSGLRVVGEAIDQALPAPKVSRPPREEVADEPELPLLDPRCPVIPLGKLGQVCYFLDELGQLVALEPQKMGDKNIRNLFGRQSALCDELWPRFGDNGKQNGWKPQVASDLLARAAAFEGIFDPQGKVRDRGAHRGLNGELILHCGDVVLVAGKDGAVYHQPGKLGRFVYPTAPGIPRPAPATSLGVSAESLLSLFGSWYWARPDVDPFFLLGWVGAAMIGGVLRWRPHAWITGSSSTGKSTLQMALEALMDGGALHTHDATEAAIRQLLGLQTMPVFFDELEPDEGGDNRRNKAVIKLARLASSGGKIGRGGQDHNAHEFTARSCFLFSSILVPPQLAQDRNRLAMLELERIPDGAVAPVIDEGALRETGRELRARLVAQWSRFETTLQAYRQALGDAGHNGRSQDQFGTLLACADLLLYDHAPDKALLSHWGAMLPASSMAEKAGDVSDEEEAVQYLGSRHLQSRGGDEPMPVTRHIKRALGADDSARYAMDRLENFGMKIVNARATEKGAIGAVKPVAGKALFLAIANKHEALAKIFDGSRWAEGVWSQALARVKLLDQAGAVRKLTITDHGGRDLEVDAAAIKRVNVRFAGSAALWSTLVPLEAIVDLTPED